MGAPAENATTTRDIHVAVGHRFLYHYPIMQKHELQLDISYDEPGDETRTAAYTARPSTQAPLPRMAEVCVAFPQASSPLVMLKATFSTHYRACEASSGRGGMSWVWWMMVVLPLYCSIELMSILGLWPGALSLLYMLPPPLVSLDKAVNSVTCPEALLRLSAMVFYKMCSKDHPTSV